MADLLDPPDSSEPGRIIDEPVGEALSTRYLAYALSTITQRALPDVRDGLKPVQRRILYAMRELKLNPDQGFKKCAKIVGEVMGNYHPHGDSAIYDALVRLAQDFAVRYPLVDGQGNFGNVDGDNAAAMRYTEAKLTAAAEALLVGIDEDAVDFRATYDGADEEPAVLPAAFPNLLANGAAGIAVGMATNIPPHNAAELIDASKALIADPDMTLDALLEIVPGPDLPTGGVIVEPKAAIAEAYATGRGAFRTRARWEREELGRGQYRIVVTEIPYQVQKSKLVERIAELIEQRKTPLLADVRDESAEDIRLVLEPRSRGADPDALMQSLFRQCDLETRVSLNLNVLDAAGAPGLMGLKEALQAFLDHRREVLQRRTRRRLEKIAQRLEVLAGYLVAYLNLDEVIRIVREEDDPKAALIDAFSLTEVQAEAILNMRLRALRKLEEMEIRQEDANLKEEQAELRDLLASEDAQWGRIDAELDETRTLFADDSELGRRRTTFADAPATREVAVEALVAREPITVVLSRKGWIRALRGRQTDASELKFKEGDAAAFVLPAETTDRIVLFATDGRFYTIGADKLPGGRGHGEPVRLMVDLAEDHEPVALFVFKKGEKRLIASSAGRGFVAPVDALVAQTRAGKQALVLDAGEEAAVCATAVGDHVAAVGENRKLLLFPLSELPEMTRGKGVRLQNLRQGGLADAVVFDGEEGFFWTDAGGRRVACPDWEGFLGKRAQAGKNVPRGFPRSGLLTPRGGA
ncbi:MAG: DNA topoisomerase IV subunit A [Caulobacterales bacterium]|nr:DNA topoisomerase IV subunit A [Caulobacterales bacterium]